MTVIYYFLQGEYTTEIIKMKVIIALQ
jgi:hypothetical protein